MRFALSAGFGCIVLAIACGDTDGPNARRGDLVESTETVSPEAPTFYDDVAPIFTEKCVQCHREGGIAPFSLSDYEVAKSRASMIADFTASRTMPPFFIETGGECGSFDESAALTEEQIALIGAWARAGATEGTPRELTIPTLPSLTEGMDFSTPAFTPQLQADELTRFDEFRCFMSPLALDRDRYVTGYEVIPGHPRLVHHVLAVIIDPNRVTPTGLTNTEVMDRLHDASPDPTRDGWYCTGLAGAGIIPESAPVIWAPGEGVVTLPGGSGLLFKQDWRVVIQVHYNMANTPPEPDETKVRLQLADAVERQGTVRFEDQLLSSIYGANPQQLEPGRESVTYAYESSGAELGLPEQLSTEVMWLWPHMHGRGHKLTMEVDNGAGYSCAARVNAWDSNWQRIYKYAAPLPFDANSRLRVTCEYDTSRDTQPVLPGWSANDEMCFVMMLLRMPPGVAVPPGSIAPPAFVEASRANAPQR